MIASPQLPLTPDEYLQLEADSSVKHEYIDGKAYAMAGTTDTHNILAGNLFTLIRSHLRGTPCRVYFADVKARLESLNRFYYPDLLVTSDPRDRDTSTYKRFPKLIVEILSEGTEVFDRGDKFHDYRSLESLEEYVLISSNRQQVEIFRRGQQGEWIYQAMTPTEERFTLQSLDLTVSLVDLYEDADIDR